MFFFLNSTCIKDFLILFILIFMTFFCAAFLLAQPLVFFTIEAVFIFKAVFLKNLLGANQFLAILEVLITYGVALIIFRI